MSFRMFKIIWRQGRGNTMHISDLYEHIATVHHKFMILIKSLKFIFTSEINNFKISLLIINHNHYPQVLMY